MPDTDVVVDAKEGLKNFDGWDEFIWIDVVTRLINEVEDLRWKKQHLINVIMANRVPIIERNMELEAENAELKAKVERLTPSFNKKTIRPNLNFEGPSSEDI